MPTNQWGVDVVVVNSVVTEVHDRQTTGAPPVTIPADGYVLSGHGDVRAWLLAHATPGETVTQSSLSEVPPGTTVVSANDSSYVIGGTDVWRATDQLIRYTSATAPGFPPNQGGQTPPSSGGRSRRSVIGRAQGWGHLPSPAVVSCSRAMERPARGCWSTCESPRR